MSWPVGPTVELPPMVCFCWPPELVLFPFPDCLPPVVVGLVVYLLLSRSGVFGTFGLLFTPTAMIIAQTILVAPIIAA